MTTATHPTAPVRNLDAPERILAVGNLGVVRVRAHRDSVLVSNHAQYDRGTGRHGTGPSNGVTDLVFRQTPHIVSVFFSVTVQENGVRVEYSRRADSDFRRADQFLVNSSAAAVRKLTEEISLALAAFLDTDDGRRFLADGAVWSAETTAAMRSETVESARAALVALEESYNEAMEDLAVVQAARDELGGY